ncbi:hypothetical protein L4D06_16590 [Enterovibrio makurazakiensis]|uniref:type IV toxin-antitoxin system AbiEi family antitoxin n=1 Tax=Enterovibrio makurazakiensis TaxID=2910232 RepID=UPI003D221CA2
MYAEVQSKNVFDVEAYLKLMQEEFDLPYKKFNYIHCDRETCAELARNGYPTLRLHHVPKATGHSIPLFMSTRHAFGEDKYVLVSDYINPSFAESLKQNNIQFLDKNGNAYLKQKPFYIYVRGNKNKSASSTKASNPFGRAFNNKGLQVVFVLLTASAPFDLTYRDLSERAGVSLGVVGPVLKDLEANGYIDMHYKGIVDRRGLIKAWTKNYTRLINRNQTEERFTTEYEDWDSRFMSLADDALIGGEFAADKYTHYLNSRSARVYADNQTFKDIQKSLRLRRVKPGEYPLTAIEHVTPFTFIDVLRGKKSHLVHPLIVYAELLASNDARNAEVAERLYEKWLN